MEKKYLIISILINGLLWGGFFYDIFIRSLNKFSLLILVTALATISASIFGLMNIRSVQNKKLMAIGLILNLISAAFVIYQIVLMFLTLDGHRA